MSFFSWKGSSRSESAEHTGRNLQDGLFQIASQACHILVQVNNTHNVSYGGSNNVKNVAYSKCSTGGGDPTSVATCSATRGTASTVKSYTKYTKERSKDQDVVVLLPHRRNRTPIVKHKLSTVSENARLEVNRSNCSGGGDGGGSNSYNGAPDDDLELWDQSGYMLRNDTDDSLTNGKWGGAHGWCRPSCIPITVILILIVLVVLLPLLDHAADKYASDNSSYEFNPSCMNGCNFSFVETLPVGMNYTDDSVSLESTYDSWANLISLAREKIEIASFYWTLRREDVYPDDSAKQGEEILRLLLEAGRDRNIILKITQNMPSQVSPNIDTEILARKANAKVRSLNFAGLFGGGVLHTKLWVVDRTHVYVGSANMDWRSLSQVKELGLVALNCSCLANDYAKIFDVYWTVGADGKIPPVWPDSLSTNINIKNPLNFTFMDNKYETFISVLANNRRRFKERSYRTQDTDLTDSYAGVKIQVRRFVVPTTPEYDKIPYSRVNHNKYMVTDAAAYIGTSNWSGDYFINTAGIGTAFESIGDETSDNLRQQLQNIFHRDWYSEYSYPLNKTVEIAQPPANTIGGDYYMRSSRYVLA